MGTGKATRGGPQGKELHCSAAPLHALANPPRIKKAAAISYRCCPSNTNAFFCGAAEGEERGWGPRMPGRMALGSSVARRDEHTQADAAPGLPACAPPAQNRVTGTRTACGSGCCGTGPAAGQQHTTAVLSGEMFCMPVCMHGSRHQAEHPAGSAPPACTPHTPAARSACPARSTAGRSRPRCGAPQTAAWPGALPERTAGGPRAARSRRPRIAAAPTWAPGPRLQACSRKAAGRALMMGCALRNLPQQHVSDARRGRAAPWGLPAVRAAKKAAVSEHSAAAAAAPAAASSCCSRRSACCSMGSSVPADPEAGSRQKCCISPGSSVPKA